MKKTVTVNLDDLEVSIDLEKIIEREVEKRLKKRQKSEFLIDHGGRRQGNTYRLMLYAQLLASDEPNQNILVVGGNHEIARMLFRTLADTLAYNKFVEINGSSLEINYKNSSRILFSSPYNLEEKMAGIKNPILLFDNSFNPKSE